MKFKVILVGTYRFITDIGFQLDLYDVFYVPSVFRNLISLSKLDLDGFSFIFANSSFKLIKKIILVGTKILCNRLYKLNLDFSFEQFLFILNVNVKIKYDIINESSSILWHRWLGYISKERMTKLVKKDVLSNLNFSDFGMCIDCIKGKQIKSHKKHASRSQGL